MSIEVYWQCKNNDVRKYIQLSYTDQGIDMLWKTLVGAHSNNASGLIVTGEAGLGKSTLVTFFAKLANAKLGNPHAVKNVSIPTRPSVDTFYHEVLQRFNEPAPARPDLKKMRRATISLFKGLDTQMLIIDEFNHLIELRRDKGIDELIVELKYLINELGVAIVIVGSGDITAVKDISKQVSSRLKRIFTIPSLDLKDELLRDDFRFFITEFSANNEIYFDSSVNWSDDTMLLRMFAAAEGDFRSLVTILKDARYDSLKSKEGEVTYELLAESFGFNEAVLVNGIEIEPFTCGEKELHAAFDWVGNKSP